MRYVALLIAALLLPGLAGATTYTMDGAEDFGGTFSGAYDTILFDLPGNHIELDSGIFTSTGAYSHIDFDDDTVIFHTTQNTNNGSRIGMLVQGNFTNIYGIKIEAYQASTDSGCVALQFGGSVGITVDGEGGFVRTKGKDSNPIYTDMCGNLHLKNFNATNFCVEMTDRQYGRGYAIWLNDFNLGTYELDSSYGYWVENITIDSGRGGIQVNGNGDPIIIQDCNITIDAHNDISDTTDAGANEGVANSFAIAVDNYGTGSRIVACSVFTGTNHQGGRGISFNDHGPASYYETEASIELCSSYFNVWSGYDDVYGWGYVGHALQSEEANDGISIYDNHFELTVTDTDSLKSYMGNRGVTVYFGHSGTTTQFYRNRVICNAIDGAVLCAALGLDQNLNAPGGGTINAYDNYFESPSNVVLYGAITGGGRDASSDCVFTGDTIYRSETFSDSSAVDGTIGIVNSDVASTDNYFTDIEWLTGDTTVDLQATGVAKEITLQRSLNITVLDSANLVYGGADVWWENGYSQTATDTSSFIGYYTDTVTVQYHDYGVGPDSTGFNDFIIGAASVYSDTAWDTLTIGLTTSTYDTLTLAATTKFAYGNDVVYLHKYRDRYHHDNISDVDDDTVRTMAVVFCDDDTSNYLGGDPNDIDTVFTALNREVANSHLHYTPRYLVVRDAALRAAWNSKGVGADSYRRDFAVRPDSQYHIWTRIGAAAANQHLQTEWGKTPDTVDVYDWGPGMTNLAAAEGLIHENGHHYRFYHTHQGYDADGGSPLACDDPRREPPHSETTDSIKEATGDFIKDLETDPRFTSGVMNESGWDTCSAYDTCFYSATSTPDSCDVEGHNIMSYGVQWADGLDFTNDQLALMRAQATNHRRFARQIIWVNYDPLYQ